MNTTCWCIPCDFSNSHSRRRHHRPSRLPSSAIRLAPAIIPQTGRVDRLSKLLRMSQGARQRYTRTLAGRWIIRAAPTLPCAACRHPPHRRCVAAPLLEIPVPRWPQPPMAAVPRSLPTQSAPAHFAAVACARRRSNVPRCRSPCRTAARSSRCCPQIRRFAPATPLTLRRHSFAHEMILRPSAVLGKRGSADAYQLASLRGRWRRRSPRDLLRMHPRVDGGPERWPAPDTAPREHPRPRVRASPPSGSHRRGPRQSGQTARDEAARREWPHPDQIGRA